MKRKLVEDAILLDEPLDELPDAPIGDVAIEEPKVDQEIVDNAMASLLSNEVASTYSRIDSLKSIVATISTEMPERDDITSILNQIIDECTMHIGMLQNAADRIDGKTDALIDAGDESADAIAEEGSDNEGGALELK